MNTSVFLIFILSSSFNIIDCKTFSIMKSLELGVEFAEAAVSFALNSKLQHVDIIVCNLNQVSLDIIMRKFQESLVSTAVYRTIPKTTIKNSLVIHCDDGKFNFTSETLDSNGFHTFIIQNTSRVEIETTFKELWSQNIHHVALITQIQVFTFTAFQEGKCFDFTANLHSKFINGSWSPPISIPKRFDNLHNCPIKANAMENSPIVFKKRVQGETFEFDGIEVVFIREIAKSLNFHIDIESCDTDHGTIDDDNKTFTGTIRHAITGNADLILGSFYLTNLRSKFLTATQTYRFDWIRVVRLRDAPYTPIENLLRPFNLWLTLAVLFMLVSGCLSMILIRCFKISDASLTHLLNVLEVFLGGSQTRLPTRNFLRILFISFAFVCLIIRTIYQGSLFAIMQTEDRKTGITSIDEMVDKKFTFYVSTSFAQQTKDLKYKFHER